MKMGLAMLCSMAHALLTEETQPASSAGKTKEQYLHDMEECSSRRLQRIITFKFVKRDFLVLSELLLKENIFERVKKGELGRSAAVIAMIVTDGELRERYKDVAFSTSMKEELEITMVVDLMKEMGTNVIYLAIKEKLMNAVPAEYDNMRGVNEDTRKLIIKRYFRNPRDSRWIEVLGLMLGVEWIRKGIEEGKYNEGLKCMVGNRQLRGIFYGYILRTPKVLDEMASRNGRFARWLVSNLIMEGYWLYLEGFEGAVTSNQKIVRLFSGHDMFWRIRKECGYSGALSIERLRELVREGRLDGVVKRVAERLAINGYLGNLLKLLKLLKNVEKARVFLNTRELYDELKEGLYVGIGNGNMGALGELSEMVPKIKELLAREEFYEVFKRGLRKIMEDGNTGSLGRLARGVPRINEVLGLGELDGELENGLRTVIKGSILNSLEGLSKDLPRANKVLGDGGLDGELIEELAKTIETNNIYFLGELSEGVQRICYLLDAGKLDGPLEKRLPGLIEDEDVRCLIEVSGKVSRTDKILDKGGCDGIIQRKLDMLIEKNDMDVLGRLSKNVQRVNKVFASGRLDEAIRRKLDEITARDDMYDLKQFSESVPRANDVLADGKFDEAIKRGLEIALEKYIPCFLQMLSDSVSKVSEILGKGELDGPLNEKLEKLIGKKDFYALGQFVKHVPGARRLLLGGKYNEKLKTAIKKGSTYHLGGLLEAVPEIRQLLVELLDGGELCEYSKKEVEALLKSKTGSGPASSLNGAED